MLVAGCLVDCHMLDSVNNIVAVAVAVFCQWPMTSASSYVYHLSLVYLISYSSTLFCAQFIFATKSRSKYTRPPTGSIWRMSLGLGMCLLAILFYWPARVSWCMILCGCGTRYEKLIYLQHIAIHSMGAAYPIMGVACFVMGTVWPQYVLINWGMSWWPPQK